MNISTILPLSIHCRRPPEEGDYELFKQYTALVNDENSIKTCGA